MYNNDIAGSWIFFRAKLSLQANKSSYPAKTGMSTPSAGQKLCCAWGWYQYETWVFLPRWDWQVFQVGWHATTLVAVQIWCGHLGTCISCSIDCGADTLHVSFRLREERMPEAVVSREAGKQLLAASSASRQKPWDGWLWRDTTRVRNSHALLLQKLQLSIQCLRRWQIQLRFTSRSVDGSGCWIGRARSRPGSCAGILRAVV